MKKYTKFLLLAILIMSIVVMNPVYAEGFDLCEESGVLQVFKLIGFILYIAKLLIPVILILWGMIQFAKVVLSGDDKDFKESLRKFVTKIIAAIIVFFIPTIVGVIIGLISEMAGYDSNFKDCQVCFDEPMGEKCEDNIDSAKNKIIITK